MKAVAAAWNLPQHLIFLDHLFDAGADQASLSLAILPQSRRAFALPSSTQESIARPNFGSPDECKLI